MKFSDVLLCWFVLYLNLSIADSFWGSPYSRGVKTDGDVGNEPPRNEPKEQCDENQLMLQLARLYVSSPERIILLLTMDPIAETCQDITDVLNRINTTTAECIPLPRDNLYTKLRDGVELFYSNICGTKKQMKRW